MSNEFPTVVDMKVIPVAGYDSLLLSLSGAHSPWFTRNLIILTDSSGHTGVGEVHGGEDLRKTLESFIPFVEGTSIYSYRDTIRTMTQKGWKPGGNNGEGLQKLDLSKLKYVVKAESAVECALLDLLGKATNQPVCSLIGEGKLRDEVEVLGYLFYIADKNKVDLPYLDESDSSDVWFRRRRQTALTPAQVVEEACAAQERYGFRNFKIKGGVQPGEVEIETVCALKKQFPQARVNLDPNGAWTLEQAIALCKDMPGIMTYVEDPCGPEMGFSSREIMSEFKIATGMQVATNMIATDWRQLHHAVALKAVDIVLADPHFWTITGSARCGQVLSDWGMTWGCHSNNSFDISLALSVHTAASCRNVTPLDSHWIWQDGQQLCDDTMQIQDGKVRIPDAPGLGININMEKVEEAHKLYNKLGTHDRNDAAVMQYLIPGWTFDSKKPTLVR